MLIVKRGKTPTAWNDMSWLMHKAKNRRVDTAYEPSDLWARIRRIPNQQTGQADQFR